MTNSPVPLPNERPSLYADRVGEWYADQTIPLLLPDGTEVRLSPGAHNEVQVAIIKQFAATFAHGSELVLNFRRY